MIDQSNLYIEITGGEFISLKLHFHLFQRIYVIPVNEQNSSGMSGLNHNLNATTLQVFNQYVYHNHFTCFQ